MRNKLKSARNKLIVIAIIIIIIITFVCSALLLVIKEDYKSNSSAFESEVLQKYDDQYQTILYCHRMLARSYYEKIISNERILEIMWEANYSDESKSNLLRNELYELSLYDYGRAVDDNYRQYHFVLHDNTSFLRMHKPESYGDDLLGIRESVRIANEEGIYVEGFEEGRVFNGYRFEFPLFYKEESVGCVEISLSYAAITDLMRELFNTRVKFLVKKQIVDEKVWDDLVGITYAAVPFTNDYYIDVETQQQDQKIASEGVLELISNINLNGDTIYKNVTRDGTDYCVVFLSIANITGEHAGYLVFINECTQFHELKDRFYILTYGIIVTWFLVFIIILLFMHNKMKMGKITYFDKLTGAYNRNKLYDFVEQEMKRDNRYKTNMSVILFDVDDFKVINDTYGHIIGDKVLRNVGQMVISNIRANDILFRYGGDEFLILLSNTDIDEAKLAAKKIEDILKTESIKEIQKSISVSFGVVQYNRKESVEQLIHRADTDLYVEKQKRKGRQ